MPVRCRTISPLPTGPTGPTGPAGSDGSTGPTGPTGPAGTESLTSDDGSIQIQESGSTTDLGVEMTALQTGTFRNVAHQPYNAVLDGVADDTAAIQAAVDAGPGIVFIPPGTARTTAAIVLDSDVTLMGAGPAATKIIADNLVGESIIRTAVSGTWSQSAGGRRFRIRIWGLEVDNQSDLNLGARGIDFRQITFGEVLNCTIRDCDIGLDAGNFTTQCLFQGLDIVNGSLGVRAVNGTRACEFNRIRTVNSDIGYDADKGVDDNVNDLTFIKCEVAGFDEVAGFGMRFGESATLVGECDNILLLGCRIEEPGGGTGIRIGRFVSDFFDPGTFFTGVANEYDYAGTLADGRFPVTWKNSAVYPGHVRAGLNSNAKMLWNYLDGPGIVLARTGDGNSYISVFGRDLLGNGVTSRVGAARLQLAEGTDWDGTEIVLSAAWGSTATASVTVGSNDSRATVTITPGGTGIVADPTVDITFKNGGWVSWGNSIVARNDANSPAGVPITWQKLSNTGLRITFHGTPVSGDSVTLEILNVG